MCAALLTRHHDPFNDPVRIEVRVDPDCETINTNTNILTARSEFFRKVHSVKQKEDKNRAIHLLEDSAEIVAHKA